MKQRVLVCGGRDYANRELVFEILDAAHHYNPIELLIHGAAPGADNIAGKWADERLVPTQEFPADWKAHGRSAGPIRNKQMLETGRPHLVIAFPGGRGTKNMIDQARARNVPVATVRDSTAGRAALTEESGASPSPDQERR